MFIRLPTTKWHERGTRQTGQRNREYLQKGEIDSQQPNAQADCPVSSRCLLGGWRPHYLRKKKSFNGIFLFYYFE